MEVAVEVEEPVESGAASLALASANVDWVRSLGEVCSGGSG